MNLISASFHYSKRKSLCAIIIVFTFNCETKLTPKTVFPYPVGKEIKPYTPQPFFLISGLFTKSKNFC